MGLDHCCCQEKEVKKFELAFKPCHWNYVTVYLKLKTSSATESGSTAKGVLHSIWKLIALHLLWLHKGMMFWIKSQTKVNTVFKRSTALVCVVLVCLFVFMGIFEQEREPDWKFHYSSQYQSFWIRLETPAVGRKSYVPEKHKKWLHKTMKNSHRRK